MQVSRPRLRPYRWIAFADAAVYDCQNCLQRIESQRCPGSVDETLKDLFQGSTGSKLQVPAVLGRSSTDTQTHSVSVPEGQGRIGDRCCRSSARKPRIPECANSLRVLKASSLKESAAFLTGQVLERDTDRNCAQPFDQSRILDGKVTHAVNNVGVLAL